MYSLALVSNRWELSLQLSSDIFNNSALALAGCCRAIFRKSLDQRMVCRSTGIASQQAKLALFLPRGTQTLKHSSFRNSNERFQDSTSFINLAQLIPRQVTRDGRTMSPCCGLLEKKKQNKKNICKLH